MPKITDWLMVIITGIYVVATILICFYNAKSTKAMREQTAESKRQFKETKKQFHEEHRLLVIPFIVYELIDDDSELDQLPDLRLQIYNINSSRKQWTMLGKKLVMKNIGLATAANIQFIWKNCDSTTTPNSFPITFLPVGVQKEIVIDFYACKEDGISCKTPSLVLIYPDLLGNHYQQTLDFTFGLYSLDRIVIETMQFSTAKVV